MAQTTLADLSAFNPVANQYALAGFTVGEILAMPEFADFAQFQAEQTGGTATSAGLANLEAQLRDRGSPEDRFGYKEPQKTDRFWCSALVGYIYTRVGILDGDNDWSIMIPSDFSIDGEKLTYSGICKLNNSQYILI